MFERKWHRYNYKHSKRPELFVDSSLLRIIISNAIRNAPEATEEVSFRSPSRIIINGGLTDKGLWISVIDDGVGLKSDEKILFKSRFTTKPGHKGFGLAIVQKAVSTLNGTWDLKDGKFKGAEFYFDVPTKVS